MPDYIKLYESSAPGKPMQKVHSSSDRRRNGNRSSRRRRNADSEHRSRRRENEQGFERGPSELGLPGKDFFVRGISLQQREPEWCGVNAEEYDREYKHLEQAAEDKYQRKLQPVPLPEYPDNWNAAPELGHGSQMPIQPSEFEYERRIGEKDDWSEVRTGGFFYESSNSQFQELSPPPRKFRSVRSHKERGANIHRFQPSSDARNAPYEQSGRHMRDEQYFEAGAHGRRESRRHEEDQNSAVSRPLETKMSELQVEPRSFHEPNNSDDSAYDEDRRRRTGSKHAFDPAGVRSAAPHEERPPEERVSRSVRDAKRLAKLDEDRQAMRARIDEPPRRSGPSSRREAREQYTGESAADAQSYVTVARGRHRFKPEEYRARLHLNPELQQQRRPGRRIRRRTDQVSADAHWFDKGEYGELDPRDSISRVQRS